MHATMHGLFPGDNNVITHKLYNLGASLPRVEVTVRAPRCAPKARGVELTPCKT